MSEEIKISYDEKKVIVSSQVLEKIRYLTRKDDVYSTSKTQMGTEMDIHFFYEKIESIVRKSTTDMDYLPSRDNEIGYNTQLMDTLLQQYNELLPKEKRETSLDYYISSVDANTLNVLLEIIYRINIEQNNFYLMRDLINAKNDCVANMKYFVDDAVIFQFSMEYDKAIQTKDTKRMHEMLDSIQQAILKEWEKYFEDIDAMTDDHFAFIGHSTDSTKFDEKFCSNYVSGSLFNQDLTDTYRLGYGFILAPKKIVGAKSQDMSVNNYVQDEDDLLFYSVIKRIDHPQRLIDECLKLKHENVENGEDGKVYSEIIFNGFDPIGIFCFTDGSKSLNRNYRCAQKLQESFPHLKIRSFDIMKRKQGLDLDKMKLALLNNLQQQFTQHTYIINEEMLSRYDYFFEEYEKMKEKKQYDETEIEALFKENDKLLSIFDTNPDDLFSGMYDEKQIKYILGKNVNYNIDYILSGKARAFALNKLKELHPYKDKLDSFYDGLSEFVELISRIDITDEMMEEINKMESINFYTISKIIASKMIASIRDKEEQIRGEFNHFQIQYNELLKEFQKRTKMQEQYDYYSVIELNKVYAEMIKEDYQQVGKDIDIVMFKEKQLQNELDEIESQLSVLNKKQEEVMATLYDNDKGHGMYRQAIEEISANVAELSKHSFLNWKRLRTEKDKLKVFEEKAELQRKKFEVEKANEIHLLDVKKSELDRQKSNRKQDLRIVQDHRNALYEQLERLKTNMREKFRCNTVNEIDVSIVQAEEFMEQYDTMNAYYLKQIKDKLEQINRRMINNQNNLDYLQEEKTTISRMM